MKKFLSANCKLVLVISFLLIFFPAFSLAVYNLWQEYNLEKENYQKETMLVAQILYAKKKNMVFQTQKLLDLIVTSKVYEADPEACSKVMSDISNQNPEYTYFGIANSSGDLICGSISTLELININYRPYFQKMAEERKFVAGDYSIGSITGKPVVPFIEPIFGPQDQIIGAAVAFHDLMWKEVAEENINFPDNATVIISDGRGTILNYFPENSGYIGKKLKDTSLGNAILGKKEKGTIRALDPDGTEKVYSFIPFYGGSDNVSFYIIVGVDDRISLRKMAYIFISNSVLLLGAAVLAFIVARKECDECMINSKPKDENKLV